jgi:glucose-6-phosphate isomerase
MVLRHEDVRVDLSKHRAKDETLALLIALAEERGVPEAIARMFAGEKINVTEGRAVLHVALRNRSSRPIVVEARAFRVTPQRIAALPPPDTRP